MRLALFGAGNRITFQYALNLEQHFSDTITLVAVFDTNHHRALVLSNRLAHPIPVYTDAAALLSQETVDTVLIGTVDATHDEYIVQAMEAGCDVICEKPITTTPEKAKRIQEAQQRTGRKLTITFNYRFTFFASRIKELLNEGNIGTIESVHFEWMLDKAHGADYFRRWHRQKKNSGGLAVHKATHHFDLINWLLGAKATRVYAEGDLKFYGAHNSPYHGEHCRVCSHQAECPFFNDYRDQAEINAMYYQGETEDGYHRDGCVFSPDIDIEDTISAVIRYDNAVTMTYSLVAYAQYEGYRLVINGTHGRIEAEDYHGLIGPYKNQQVYRLRRFDDRAEIVEYTIPNQQGSHGGGDDRMMRMLFSATPPQDTLGQMASSADGFNAAMIGMAINASIEKHTAITIADLEA